MSRAAFAFLLLTLAPIGRVARGAEPADGWLVWQRGAPRQDAPREIWLMKADSSRPSRLTNGGGRQPIEARDCACPGGSLLAVFDSSPRPLINDL